MTRTSTRVLYKGLSVPLENIRKRNGITNKICQRPENNMKIKMNPSIPSIDKGGGDRIIYSYLNQKTELLLKNSSIFEKLKNTRSLNRRKKIQSFSRLLTEWLHFVSPNSKENRKMVTPNRISSKYI